jgi:plastocyanin
MNLNRFAALGATVLASALGVAIPTGALGSASASSIHTVKLHEFRFHPAKLSIHRGDKVKWVWQDQVEHNVTFHGFHSRTQVKGSYTVRFTKAGTYSYRCTIHAEEGMRGKIVVR